MKRFVDVVVRSIPSRRVFHPSTYQAQLVTPHGTVLGTTRGHASWNAAALAALALAARREYVVENEQLVRRRLGDGLPPTSPQGA